MMLLIEVNLNRMSVAVYYDHIEPFLPFVSDLGVLPPEASLFSIFMNVGSILIIFVAIIRYESTKTLNENNKSLTSDARQSIDFWNNCSLVTGMCMAVGFIIVANFRNSEGVIVQIIHNVGAVFGFFSTVFDMYFQSRVASTMSHNQMARVRLALTVWALALAVTYNVLSIVSFVLNPNALGDTLLRLKWSSDQNGYVLHVLSTFLEWILIFSLSPYFLTFVSQFKKFSLSKRLVVYKDANHNIVDRDFG